jgi:hypothetical protein
MPPHAAAGMLPSCVALSVANSAGASCAMERQSDAPSQWRMQRHQRQRKAAPCCRRRAAVRRRQETCVEKAWLRGTERHAQQSEHPINHSTRLRVPIRTCISFCYRCELYRGDRRAAWTLRHAAVSGERSCMLQQSEGEGPCSANSLCAVFTCYRACAMCVSVCVGMCLFEKQRAAELAQRRKGSCHNEISNPYPGVIPFRTETPFTIPSIACMWGWYAINVVGMRKAFDSATAFQHCSDC